MNRALVSAIIVAALLSVPAGLRSQDRVREARRRGETGSISGRVTTDGGQPISNAAITLTGAGRGGAGYRAAATDDDGRFQVDDLQPGAYTVIARAPGFAVAQDEDDFSRGPHYRLGDSITITMMKGAVITGRVTTPSGEPVVAAPVRALRVRDAEGKRVGVQESPFNRFTDDRGIYRIYGLLPGSYVVAVAVKARSVGVTNAYYADVPTYHPSSSRETAAEVVVRKGDEATGIDIKHRGERGYTVSGTVSGQTDSSQRGPGIMIISVALSHASSRTSEAQATVERDGSRAFEIAGVAEGDYDIEAMQETSSEQGWASAPRRIRVKGADVTGVMLAMRPLGSISGRLVLEQVSAECKGTRHGLIEETLLTLRRDERPGADRALPRLRGDSSAVPSGSGEFAFWNLVEGRYRIGFQLPSEEWYVRDARLSGPRAPASSQVRDSAVAKGDSAGNGLSLQSGQRVEGLSVFVAAGAARIGGRVISAKEDEPLPADLHLHLVPAEPASSGEVLRFYETPVQPDGTFAISNVAPGHYRVVTRVKAPEVSLDEMSTSRPVAWDAAARAKLIKDAESANLSIELKPCQRIDDYVLGYSPSQGKKTSGK